MEVRPGYKLTELGVIPEEWDDPRVDALGAGRIPPIKAGPFGSSLTKDQYVPDGYKIYGQEQVIAGDYLFGDYFITLEKYRELESCAVRPGDVLLSLVGTVGRLLEIPEGAAPGIINPRLIRFSFDRERVLPRFFKYVFESASVQSLLARQAQGGTMGVLNAGVLRPLRIPLPPLPEQRAIAAALGDVDALLVGLDRLIAKKRDLKQAAMQQLLTGQTRLPGFQGEWEETRFEKVVTHHAGNSTLIKGKLPSTEAAGLFPAYSASGQDVWCDHFEHEGNAIVVSAVGSRCGKAFSASGKWCAIANTHVVWPNPAKIDRRILGYFIDDEDFWQKSGTGQPFVLFARTFARPLRLPALPEQSAIAAVLSDMDAELSALEARRAKTRALKQGMMQELLTGRTRLV